jgi:hypothetical protein
MKQCRFGLDDSHIDADLCKKIDEIANGGSWNDAVRLYLRILHYQNNSQNVTPGRQNSTVESADNDSDNNSQEISLSGLDSIFSDTGE